MNRPASTAPEPDFVMPIPADNAAWQFFLQQMRAQTEQVRAVRDEFIRDRDDRREDRKLLSDIHERVIRIEANRIDRRVEKLEADVDALKAREDQREGATGAAQWLLKNMPNIATIIASIMLVSFLILKAGGRF